MDDKPTLKIWATEGDVFIHDETGYPAIRMIVTGLLPNEQTEVIICTFDTEEDALEIKREIDNSFEPLIKEIEQPDE